jgi:magnesium-transporting ATPase (P-type)
LIFIFKFFYFKCVIYYNPQVGILTQRKYDTLYKIRNPNHVKAKAIVLNGNEIDSMSKQEWLVVCRNYEEIVLSRATPTHKLICLREFQTNGFATMMVGDGVNDVMALKSANISVAMAAGSRIVSEIAQIVLIDNDYTYIYQLILSGKQTFGNIKKMFLYFTVVSIYAEVFTTLFSTLFGIPNFFSNYCILIICVVTDAIPAFTFVYEAPDPIKKKVHTPLYYFHCLGEFKFKANILNNDNVLKKGSKRCNQRTPC